MADSDVTLSAKHIAMLDHMLSDMGYQGVWCFYVVADQDTEALGGYIPAMVFQDVQSYFSMNGPLYGDVPFIIGQTLSEARERCKLMNKHIQLTHDKVEEILESAGLKTD